eukprot:11848101-Alexandrium_andersonii.AAC.1
MSASLVGSEMCIRDSPKARPKAAGNQRDHPNQCKPATRQPDVRGDGGISCLLYTSDAADDM